MSERIDDGLGGAASAAVAGNGEADGVIAAAKLEVREIGFRDVATATFLDFQRKAACNLTGQ